MFKRFFAMLNARNKEFIRDKSSMAWNFLFPVLVILGFGFAFNGGGQDMFKVEVYQSVPANPAPESFFSTRYVQFIAAPDLQEALAKLKRHQVDMVIDSTATQPSYWVNSTAPKGYVLERMLNSSSSDQSGFAKKTVEGEEIRYVDWLISGLLGMNMMFSALFGVGYVIVRYRKNGVLKRLKATPLRAVEFLSAQVVSRYILIMAVSVIVYAGTYSILKFRMYGSYLDLFIVMSLGAVCLISVGLLVASRVTSEELAGGLLNLLSWPMMFLSGVWFSLEGASPVIKKIANIFPLTHVIDAAREIMTEGKTLAQVSGHVVVLIVMTFVCLGTGSYLFKWE